MKVQELYIDEVLQEKNIIRKSKYIKNSIPMDLKCTKCNHNWQASWSNLNHRTKPTGCPKCNHKMKDNKYIDGLLIGLDTIRISDYKNNETKIKFKCLKDGCEWETLMRNMQKSVALGYSGCPECDKERRRKWDNDKIDSIIEDKFNDNLKRIDDFVSSNGKMKWYYVPYNYYFVETFTNINTKYNRTQISFTLNDYLIDTIIKQKKINCIRIGSVENKNKKIFFECNVCNNKWKSNPSVICREITGCPNCKKKSESLLGKYIYSLRELYSSYEPQKVVYKKTSKGKFIVDFYIEIGNKKLIIEYNGKQHYEPVDFFGGKSSFINQLRRDEELRQYCNKNKIYLLEVPYTDSMTNAKDKILSFIEQGGY